MALANDYAPSEDDEDDGDELSPSSKLTGIAAANAVGTNLVDVMDENDLRKLGGECVDEFEIDANDRKEWEATARKAMDLAKQKRGEKTYPWKDASNINYPTLITAAIQFHARAYPAIIKGDQVLMNKVVGDDPLGFKQQRAKRMADFCNDQLVYEMTEWEPGTDALLMALPIIGQGFRKGGWDHVLDRPRMDYASALNVYAAVDSPSLEEAPRITQTFERYPYQVAQLFRAEQWDKTNYVPDDVADDTQKPQEFIEQHRYIDIDDDGLPEPYIVTVHRKTQKVMRIDAAFDPSDIRVGEINAKGGGQVEAVSRILPWIDYQFLPDPEGGLYGMGFGALLESLQDAIDGAFNQMFDAGHLANAPGGFIAQGLNLRGGTYRLEPNVYKFVNATGQDIRQAIYTHQFPGPSPVLMQLVDMLLAASKDITSVKDVLTGEAPAGQPATSTLALIEQGLSVFTAIYKRIYRSLRKEYRLLYKLNARYLSDERYKAVLDKPLQPFTPPQGAPPPPPAAQQAIEKQQQQGVSAKDFEDKDYDIRPIADPSAVTKMQQIGKAKLIGERVGLAPGVYNAKEAETHILQSAGVDQDDIDKLLSPPPNPMQPIQLQTAQNEAKLKDAQAQQALGNAAKANTEAGNVGVQAKGAAFDEGAKQGILGGVADEPGHAMVPGNTSIPGEPPPDGNSLGDLRDRVLQPGSAGPGAGPGGDPNAGGGPPI